MADSESDLSDLDDLNWSYKNRKQAVVSCHTTKKDTNNDKHELPIQVHEVKIVFILKKITEILLNSAAILGSSGLLLLF